MAPTGHRSGPSVDASKLGDTLAGLAASNFAIAIAALTQGAKDIEDLRDSCDRLRAELASTEDRHRRRTVTLKDEIAHWRDQVNGLLDSYRSAEAKLDEAHCNSLAVARAASRNQTRAAEAESRSRSFEQLLLRIHDQILAAIVRDRCITSESVASLKDQEAGRSGSAPLHTVV